MTSFTIGFARLLPVAYLRGIGSNRKGVEMAFARLAYFPGGTEEQHRAVAEALGGAHAEVEGRILFAAGPVEGGWQIVQIWESEEALGRFVENNLKPAFEKVGDRGYQAPPEVTDFPVHDLLQ